MAQNTGTANLSKLTKKAQACLNNKPDMPSSPLWNLGYATKFNSSSHAKELQDALDYLTCKARANVLSGKGLKFSDDEKEFLMELYEAFWWGGQYKGYSEAAKLADHYVHGNGKKLYINSEVYEKSKIVIATMEAMKEYIAELKAQNKYYTKIKCNNLTFMSKPYAQKLKRMNYRTEGKMKPGGVLESAQNNHRLHKADGHFYLEAVSLTLADGKMKTTWRVDSLYDFEPFVKNENRNYFTEIPLGNTRLVFYDGLSEYMTRIKGKKTFMGEINWLAQKFDYMALWTEMWGDR